MKKSKKYVQSFSFAEKSLLMATVLMRLLPLQKNLVLPFKRTFDDFATQRNYSNQ
jgi:hypothetical protein